MLSLRRVAAVAALAVAATACGGSEPSTAPEVEPTSTTAPDTTATTAPSTSSTTSTSATAPSTTPPSPAPAPTDPATTTAPTAGGFAATIDEIGPTVRARMDGVSMHAGCPVGYDELRYVTVSHHGFDGTTATGELVVHRDVADDVVATFERLYDADFPIRRMVLVDDFGGSDFASIEADNTSAFNCRLRTGSTDTYSEHSYGRAIDVNPLENPYVTAAGTTSHPGSRPYLDRTVDAPGVITADGPVVAAFAAVGWGWGGDWTDVRDYQHFSRNGR